MADLDAMEKRRDTINDGGSIATQAAQARQTGREQKAVSAPAAQQASARASVPRVDAVLGGPTPGPEALASALEPAIADVVAPPQPRPARPKMGSGASGRSFLIGAAIGLVVLGATLAAMMARKGSHGTEPPSASSGTKPTH
jgi:hypothetical protein